MKPDELKSYIENTYKIDGFGYAASLYDVLLETGSWPQNWRRVLKQILEQIKKGVCGFQDTANKEGRYIWLPLKKGGMAVFFKPAGLSSTGQCVIYDIQFSERAKS